MAWPARITPYGIELVATANAVQSEIDRLRPEVDLLVALSHLGLDGDQRLIDGTTGLDVVLGGHEHLAPRPRAGAHGLRRRPGRRARLQRAARRLVHSGALGRYIGELDLELAGGPGGLFVASAEHTLIAISAEIAADPALAELLQPYRERLNAAGFDAKLAFALGPLERYAANGADSALGNLVTDALRAASGADFALLNATGIRADLPPGELTRAAFAAALPFADPLTVLTLSGAQLRTLFNQQARVASERECKTPIQISGLSLQFKCSGSSSSALASSAASGRELEARSSYTLVTSAYLADGGSGFELLTEASARRALDLNPLDVLLDAVSALPRCAESTLPCLDPSTLRDHRISLHSR